MATNSHKQAYQCAFLRTFIFSFALFTLNNVYACKKNGTAIISGHALYPPLTWERGGALTGVSIDVITAILNEVGVKVITGNPEPWKRLVHRTELGEIDILLGVRKNNEWAHYFNYVEPALTPSVQGVFFLNNTRFEYSEWANLIGKPGGILRGASFGEEFDHFAKDNLHLQETNTLQQNFYKLKKGRIQYFLAPLVTTQLYLHQEGLESEITSTAIPLTTISEYIAISKASSCNQYAAYISKRLQKMIIDESIDKIMEKYFLMWFEDIDQSKAKTRLTKDQKNGSLK